MATTTTTTTTTAITSSSSPSIPYHEPDISRILILSTFLLALNAVNHILDRLVYCGLLGQIFLGILWGTPGAKWLDVETAEIFIVNFGYSGLILLVYEGGLATSFKSLKANLGLSVGVACTGIALPIALSYVLLGLVGGASPLQAFAAGAALCSTSLGTTFTVLGTSGLVTTRMGVVLASAAMMDDVVGLVMIQVISNLGSSSVSSFSAMIVVRPIFVSLAFAVVVPLVAQYIIKPLTLWANSKRTMSSPEWVETFVRDQKFALVVHTTILLGLVTGSSYAGTSNLFAAYLAGAAISWWDSEVPHPDVKTKKDTGGAKNSVSGNQPTGEDARESEIPSADETTTSGEIVFRRYFQPSLDRILRPLFFASIGFSIPITRMFSATIVWKGMVYTLLMAFGKLICGCWLIKFRFESLLSLQRLPPTLPSIGMKASAKNEKIRAQEAKEKSGAEAIQSRTAGESSMTDEPTAVHQDRSSREPTQPNLSNTSRQITAKKSACHPHNVKNVAKPSSLYPAAIVGCAMVARGEIGFLISSLAESNGIFRNQQTPADAHEGTDDIFLIVTWAIMLCTIIGPICVGFMVRRMNIKRKQAQANGTERRDVLGVWS